VVNTIFIFKIDEFPKSAALNSSSNFSNFSKLPHQSSIFSILFLLLLYPLFMVPTYWAHFISTLFLLSYFFLVKTIFSLAFLLLSCCLPFLTLIFHTFLSYFINLSIFFRFLSFSLLFLTLAFSFSQELFRRF